MPLAGRRLYGGCRSWGYRKPYGLHDLPDTARSEQNKILLSPDHKSQHGVNDSVGSRVLHCRAIGGHALPTPTIQPSNRTASSWCTAGRTLRPREEEGGLGQGSRQSSFGAKSKSRGQEVAERDGFEERKIARRVVRGSEGGGARKLRRSRRTRGPPQANLVHPPFEVPASAPSESPSRPLPPIMSGACTHTAHCTPLTAHLYSNPAGTVGGPPNMTAVKPCDIRKSFKSCAHTRSVNRVRAYVLHCRTAVISIAPL